ncbi:MAG: alpha/beta hydrolase [Chloroflexi bacterium]|nr:alpha/beta hydrolase [Chloroflexota bacterium]MDA1002224.1 alpha/beta hydrolase [Chloroflexota bacterium]
MVGLFTHNTIVLPDGRRLGYAEYGHHEGFPIVYSHGVPGSRLSGLLAGVLAAPRGARVIALDRPGYGLSEPKPGRRIIDWPEDVRAVLDALEIERFALLGHSGGGPYACACAYAFGERVTGTAVTSGMGPVASVHASRRLTWRQKAFRATAAHARPAIRFALSRAAESVVHDVDAYLAGRASSTAPVDLEVLRRPTIRAIVQEDLREAYAQGAGGTVEDVRLLARPWGFPLGEIRTRVDLWHGEQDSVVPLWLATHVAAAIPGARAHIVRDAGHLMAIDLMDEVLDTLIVGKSDHPAHGSAQRAVPRIRVGRFGVARLSPAARGR